MRYFAPLDPHAHARSAEFDPCRYCGCDFLSHTNGACPKTDEEKAREKAEELWAAFSASEKHGIRFGLFPAAKMSEAEAAGIDGHLLACALIEVAAKNGGIRA
jgi:hypothetical protein